MRQQCAFAGRVSRLGSASLSSASNYCSPHFLAHQIHVAEPAKLLPVRTRALTGVRVMAGKLGSSSASKELTTWYLPCEASRRDVVSSRGTALRGARPNASLGNIDSSLVWSVDGSVRQL